MHAEKRKKIFLYQVLEQILKSFGAQSLQNIFITTWEVVGKQSLLKQC